MAGTMISLDALTRQSLFTLLYKIDLDLAEQTRADGCPFARGRCIMQTTSESLEAAPLIFKRLLNYVSACVVEIKAAAVVQCRHQFDSGDVGFTGHLCCCWSRPCVREETLT